jgi:hypothetical protein
MTAETTQTREGPTNGAGPTDGADPIVEAGERFLEACGSLGDAYAHACQQAATSVSGLRERLAGSAPAAWPGFVGQGDAVAATPEKLRSAAKRAAAINEQLIESNKRLGLAYVDAYERAALGLLDAHAQVSASSEVPMLRSASATQAGVARDLTHTYVDVARRLLA